MRGKWVMSFEEGTCWDEHCLLYGNQFDNKFHIKKIKKKNTGRIISSTITKLWKEPKCPSTDEWIKKLWFIYTMEYYVSMRKNEI